MLRVISFFRKNYTSIVGVALSCFLAGEAFIFPQKVGFFSFFFLIPLFFNKRLSLWWWYVWGVFVSFFSTLWFFDLFPLQVLGGVGSGVVGYVSFVLVWLLFIMAMALSFLPFFFFWKKLLEKHLEKYDIVLIPFLWVTSEYLRAWMLSFVLLGERNVFGPHHTYYSIAYSVSSIPYVRDIFAIGGMYFVSFYIVGINCLFFKAIKKNFKLTSLYFVISVLFLISIPLISHNYISFMSNKETDYISMSLVSTNFSPVLTKDDDTKKSGEVYKYLVEQSNVKNLEQFVVTPENINLFREFKKNTDSENREHFGKTLFLGSFSTPLHHLFYFYDTQAATVSLYEKRLLMPLVEYPVFWVSFLSKKFSLEDTNSILKINKGFSYVYHFPSAYDGPAFFGSLCSENISPYLYREAVLNGANFIINVASHSLFRGSKLLARQTLAINKARAIESGRFFVTSFNNSPSYVLSDRGDVVAVIPNTALVQHKNIEIIKKTYITPFVFFGDIFPVLCCMFLFFYYIWFFRVD